MKAILFKNGQSNLIEKPPPGVNENEALVKVLMTGICKTDTELLEGYYGFEGVAGHEFVGIVEEAPSDPDMIGKRVVGEINIGCGKCLWCQNGNERHCPTRKVLGIVGWDGAFAEYLKIPLRNLKVVKEKIPSEIAVFTEPLAAALEPAQQIHITGDQKILVMGDGKLGLLTALAFRHSCENLILTGRHSEKLKIAGDSGVKTILNKTRENLDELKKMGPFDIIIESTGSAKGINQAIELVRPEGTVVAKTTLKDKSEIDLAKVVVDEINIIGSRCGNFDLALKYLENGLVNPSPLITDIYPFEDFKKALELAKSREALKIIIKFY